MEGDAVGILRGGERGRILIRETEAASSIKGWREEKWSKT